MSDERFSVNAEEFGADMENWKFEPKERKPLGSKINYPSVASDVNSNFPSVIGAY